MIPNMSGDVPGDAPGAPLLAIENDDGAAAQEAGASPVGSAESAAGAARL